MGHTETNREGWWEKYLVVFGDFESYYDSELTLSATKKGYHDPIDYVHSPLFEVIGMSVLVGRHTYLSDITGTYITVPDSECVAVEPANIPSTLESIKKYAAAIGKKILFVAHNARFDGSILSWVYDWTPPLMCTILMSRALGVSHLVGQSLDAQSKKLLKRNKNIDPAWEHLQKYPDSDAAVKVLLGIFFTDRDSLSPEIKQYLNYRYGSQLYAEASAAMKFKSVVSAMEGKRHADLSGDDKIFYYHYMKADTLACRDLFYLYAPQLPEREANIIVMSLHMYTVPHFQVDVPLLRKTVTKMEAEKHLRAEKLAERIGFVGDIRPMLKSGEKFMAFVYPLLGVVLPKLDDPNINGDKQRWYNQVAIICIENDLPPPVAIKENGEFGLNLAKTSPLVKYIMEEYEEGTLLREIIEVKVSNASNIEISRMNRFLAKGLQYEYFPIPLEYAAAHTGRYGGTDKLNLQNLPSRFGSPVLRQALIAAFGYKVLSCDSSQIEARFNGWFCQDHEFVSIFARGQDPYSSMANKIYGIPYSEIVAGNAAGDARLKFMRSIGKETELACGYQMGAAKYAARLWSLGIKLAENIDEHIAIAKNIVNIYRAAHKPISDMWYKCDRAMRDLLNGQETWLGGPNNNIAHFCYTMVAGERVASIRLPGYTLFYPGLRMGMSFGKEGMEYAVKKGKSITWTRIYAGKILENIIQSLSFCCIKEQMLEMHDYSPVALNVHDEAVTVCRDEDVPRIAEFYIKAMSRPPAWAADIPLAAEVTIGQNFYGGLDYEYIDGKLNFYDIEERKKENALRAKK